MEIAEKALAGPVRYLSWLVKISLVDSVTKRSYEQLVLSQSQESLPALVEEASQQLLARWKADNESVGA